MAQNCLRSDPTRNAFVFNDPAQRDVFIIAFDELKRGLNSNARRRILHSTRVGLEHNLVTRTPSLTSAYLTIELGLLGGCHNITRVFSWNTPLCGVEQPLPNSYGCLLRERLIERKTLSHCFYRPTKTASQITSKRENNTQRPIQSTYQDYGACIIGLHVRGHKTESQVPGAPLRLPMERKPSHVSLLSTRANVNGFTTSRTGKWTPELEERNILSGEPFTENEGMGTKAPLHH